MLFQTILFLTIFINSFNSDLHGDSTGIDYVGHKGVVPRISGAFMSSLGKKPIYVLPFFFQYQIPCADILLHFILESYSGAFGSIFTFNRFPFIILF